jgi:hypothetical protein
VERLLSYKLTTLHPSASRRRMPVHQHHQTSTTSSGLLPS